LATCAVARSLPRVTPAAAHALLYATQFFAFGVILPFLPAVFAVRGMDAAQVAALLAVGSAVRLLAGPLGGRLADALAAPRAVMALGGLAAGLAACGFVFASGFVLVLALNTLMSIGFAPIVPLSDSCAIASSRRFGFDYGRVRAAGSIAFIVASLAAGQASAGFGINATIALMAGGLFATAVAAMLIPPSNRPRGGGPRGLAAFLAPLRIAPFRRLVLVSALIHGSHAFYYAFSTLHWRSVGLGDDLIGALWAAGVIAEIALFLWGRDLIAWLGPVRLSLIAAGGGLVRWMALAFVTDPWLLFGLQILHATTFAAQHLAAMQVLARVVPPAQAGTAQAVHAAFGAGLPIGALTLASGPLFAAFGGGGYVAMAALCALAVPASVALGRALRPASA
jgi:PPP family 3-phenylpropionic acid transporter